MTYVSPLNLSRNFPINELGLPNWQKSLYSEFHLNVLLIAADVVCTDK